MKNNNQITKNCEHKNKTKDGRYVICQDCGLILEEGIDFGEESAGGSYFKESQGDYERNIKRDDIKAKQDPNVKLKYEKIKTLEKWFRDYKSSFTQQKHTIEKLKTYEIGLEIDNVKFQNIKKRYLRFNKKNRKTYQNMVIIFLALIWDDIKDTTNIRIERYIEVSVELGHKVNKKMINNAMLKILKAEDAWKKEKRMTSDELEQVIKEKIKVLFQKDLNNIPFEEIKDYIKTIDEFNKLKLRMQLKANEFLDQISYNHLQNLNYKAFTAGLVYYVGQTLKNRKIFTQNLIENTARFSSTTIRKKYHILKDILGDPNIYRESN